ncbi:MAG: DUF3794 domain-containing protein, partial [Defluviitaleaceae bacterium]|nr:DUF3794 domain-containing protein [Defluviitaleaceae bacterium]
MELLRENIILNRHIGGEKSQVLLEGDIIVPDVKPDIASVLKAQARVFISKANASAGRISYSGKLTVDVLYLAKTGEVSVHSISAQAHIDDFLNMEGVQPHMMINLEAQLANVDYRVVNDRKLNYRAVVDVQAAAWENQTFDAVKSIGDLPPTQQKNAVFSMNNMVAKQIEQFTIRDEVVLPPGKSAIVEMLQVGVNIANKDMTMHAGRVDVSGNLIVTPLYKGTDETAVIEFAEFELPFSGSLEVAAAHEGAFGDVVLSLADHVIAIEPNEEGENRILSMEVVIAADIKISQNKDIEILEDAYCIDQNLGLSMQNLDYARMVCRNKNQFNAKEIVALEGAPDMLQVLSVSGMAHMDEQKVVDDKVVVEGMVEANILYVANSDTDPLYNYTAHFPIRQVIETKGAKMGMDAIVSHSIDQISFNMLSNSEVELRFNLGF